MARCASSLRGAALTLQVNVSRKIVTVLMFLAYADHKFPRPYGPALIFAKILAFSTAITGAFGNYLFGATTYQYALIDTNLILVVFIPMSNCNTRVCGSSIAACSAVFSSARRVTRPITRPTPNISTPPSADAWRCGIECSARSMCRRRSANR
jgi:hypothetical protein